MKVLQVYQIDSIKEIITSDNIDAKLDYYAEVMMMLLEIKKLIDNTPNNDYESDDEDDDISIGSDDCSLKSSDIRLVEVDTDSEEE